MPLVEADLTLVDGRLQGTVRNASDQRLEKPAVVLGSTVQVLKDLDPGQSATVDVAVQPSFFGQSISDKVVGSVFSSVYAANLADGVWSQTAPEVRVTEEQPAPEPLAA